MHTGLEKRIQEHQTENAESTKNLLLFTLIWYCAFPSRMQARRFEQYLKSESGQVFKKTSRVINPLRGYFDEGRL